MSEDDAIGILIDTAKRAAIGTEEVLVSPPGRKPDVRLVEASSWYSKLTDTEKNLVSRIAWHSAIGCMFDMLCLIDGVAAMSEPDRDSLLKLLIDRLDDPDSGREYLHDILRGSVDIWNEEELSPLRKSRSSVDTTH
jgi:hypothetical protein